MNFFSFRQYFSLIRMNNFWFTICWIATLVFMFWIFKLTFFLFNFDYAKSSFSKSNRLFHGDTLPKIAGFPDPWNVLNVCIFECVIEILLQKLFQKAFGYPIIKYWFASQSSTLGCMIRAFLNRRVSTQGWRVVNAIKLWSWIFNILYLLQIFLFPSLFYFNNVKVGLFHSFSFPNMTILNFNFFFWLFSDSYFYFKNWNRNEKWIEWTQFFWGIHFKNAHIFTQNLTRRFCQWKCCVALLILQLELKKTKFYWKHKKRL